MRGRGWRWRWRCGRRREGSGALPAPRRRLGRAGSAQGPLVGADVSPECAFIINEPPSPQEGEAGRKGASERARAGGGGGEGPGTRYKGGGGGRRRRRRKRSPPARRRAPRLPARPPAAGRCRARGLGLEPGPVALTLSGPRPPRAWAKLATRTCRCPRPGDACQVARGTARAGRTAGLAPCRMGAAGPGAAAAPARRRAELGREWPGRLA